jgi:hypothetical protein
VNTGHASAGVCDALDEAVRYRVGTDGEDDRNLRRTALRRSRNGCRECDDQIHTIAFQRARRCFSRRKVPAGIANNEGDLATLLNAHFPEALA